MTLSEKARDQAVDVTIPSTKEIGENREGFVFPVGQIVALFDWVWTPPRGRQEAELVVAEMKMLRMDEDSRC